LTTATDGGDYRNMRPFQILASGVLGVAVLSGAHAGGPATQPVAITPSGVAVALLPAPLDPPFDGTCPDLGKVAFDGSGNASVCTGAGWASTPGVTPGVQSIGAPCRQEGILAISADAHLLTCHGAAWILSVG
jgi:hypothetical protein